MAGAEQKKYKACVIGETGRGNYGHGIDVAFVNHPDCSVVAVADPDEDGRAKAVERTKAERGYADYRDMLQKEKPDLVAICTRRPMRHKDMALAAIEIGAHIFMEKPLAPTLEDADAMIQSAAQKKIKIAVAHQVRASLPVQHLKKSIEEGLIGEMVELRGCGKEDHRAGGEDLMVLGTHIFDLIQFFAGRPEWCQARVFLNGRDIQPGDAHEVDEELGLVAGDDIRAMYGMQNGTTAYFRSKKTQTGYRQQYGLDLYGTKGVASIRFAANPPISIFTGPSWAPEADGQKERGEWIPLPGDPWADRPKGGGLLHEANQLIIQDLLAAIDEDRPPAVGIHEARAALEMILSTYSSQISGGRVEIPLQDRRHPLRDY